MNGISPHSERDRCYTRCTAFASSSTGWTISAVTGEDLPVPSLAAVGESVGPSLAFSAVELEAGRCAWKHWRQRTGRPCVGLNGTVVSTPHAEQLVRVSVREMPAAAGPAPASAPVPTLRLLQGLQRFGSFLNCLSKKNSCSPAVKMNSPPQSLHVKRRSTNSMSLLLFAEKY